MKQLFTFAVFASVLCFTACSSSSNENTDSNTSVTSEKGTSVSDAVSTGKYQIKSGIYTTKAKNAMMGAAVDNSTIIYFDDYGNNELSETISKMEMAGIKQETHSYTIMKDKMIYSWDADKKTGSKYSIENLMDKNVDYEKLSGELKKQYNYQELGTEKILGKECKKISVEVTKGAAAISYTWKGIPMRTETNVAGMQMVMEVTDLQENVSIEASKFEIPADITFTEMKIPGR